MSSARPPAARPKARRKRIVESVYTERIDRPGPSAVPAQASSSAHPPASEPASYVSPPTETVKVSSRRSRRDTAAAAAAAIVDYSTDIQPITTQAVERKEKFPVNQRVLDIADKVTQLGERQKIQCFGCIEDELTRIKAMDEYLLQRDRGETEALAPEDLQKLSAPVICMYYNPAESGLIKGVRMSDVNYGRCANCMIHGRGCWWPTESLTLTPPTNGAAAMSATPGLFEQPEPELGHVIDEETHAKRSKRIEKRRAAEPVVEKKPAKRKQQGRDPSKSQSVVRSIPSSSTADTKPPIELTTPFAGPSVTSLNALTVQPIDLNEPIYVDYPVPVPIDLNTPLDLNSPVAEPLPEPKPKLDHPKHLARAVQSPSSHHSEIKPYPLETSPLRGLDPPLTEMPDPSAETNAALVRALIFMQQDDDDQNVAIARYDIAEDPPAQEARGEAEAGEVLSLEQPLPSEEPLPFNEPMPVQEPMAVEEPLTVQEPSTVDEPLLIQEEATLTTHAPAGDGLPSEPKGPDTDHEAHHLDTAERPRAEILVAKAPADAAQDIFEPVIAAPVVTDTAAPVANHPADSPIEDPYDFLTQSLDEPDNVMQGYANEVDPYAENVDEEMAMNEYGGELDFEEDEQMELEVEQGLTSVDFDEVEPVKEVPVAEGELVTNAESIKKINEEALDTLGQAAGPSRNVLDQGANETIMDVDARPKEAVQEAQEPAPADPAQAPQPDQQTIPPETAQTVARDAQDVLDLAESVQTTQADPPAQSPPQELTAPAQEARSGSEHLFAPDSVPETRREHALQLSVEPITTAAAPPAPAHRLPGGDLTVLAAPAAASSSGRTRRGRSARAKLSVNKHRKTTLAPANRSRSAVDPATYRLTQKWLDRLVDFLEPDIIVVPSSVPLRYDNTNLMALDPPGVNKVFRKCTGCTLRECDCAPLPVDEELANTEHAQYRQNAVLDAAGCLTCRICGVVCSFTLDPPIYGAFATLPSPRTLDRMRLLPEDWDTRSELDGSDGREEDEADGENDQHRGTKHMDPTFLQSNRCSGCILRKSPCIALPAGEGRGGGCVKCQECNVACSFGVATPQVDGKTIVWADADSTKAGGRAPPPEPKRATNFTTAKRRVLAVASDDGLDLDE